MAEKKPILIIMAKQPRLGAVKTRLARDIGAPAALRFYKETAQGLITDLARDQRWTTLVAVTPDPADWDPAAAFGPHSYLPQGEGDLGQRMARLFQTLPPGPLVMVGTDLPDLSRADVARAFKALGAHDWVFGPALDGGYWLVGGQRREARFHPFKDVRWSSETTLADTLKNLDGKKVALLEVRRDVDDGADLAAYLREQGT